MTEPDRAPQAGEEEESANERRRTITNIAVFMLLAVLIGAGVWLANAILEMRRIQDCAMAGRRNCAPIAVPSRDSGRVE